MTTYSLDNFDELMKQLISEYEHSGMNIDEFIQQKLKANGRTDANEIAQEINATLESIDNRFASLQNFKKNGGNREEWLRQELDSATEGIGTDKAGQVLSSSIKVLNGEFSDEPEEDASYDALDAALFVRELDDALVRNTCKTINEGEK